MYHCTLTLCRMLSLRWWSLSISAVSSLSITSPIKGSSTTPFMLSSNPPIFFPFNRIFPFRSYTHTNMEKIHFHQQAFSVVKSTDRDTIRYKNVKNVHYPLTSEHCRADSYDCDRLQWSSLHALQWALHTEGSITVSGSLIYLHINRSTDRRGFQTLLCVSVWALSEKKKQWPL